MSVQCGLFLIQSTVKDSKNMICGLLFGSLGDVEVCHILALFASEIEKHT